MPATPASELDLAPDMKRGAAVAASIVPPAGEAAATKRLRGFLEHAAGYAADRDRTDRPDATSGLSDALAAGEWSPRIIWTADERMSDAPRRSGKFRAELIWRDFAWSLLATFPQMPVRAWRSDMGAFLYRHDKSSGSRPRPVP